MIIISYNARILIKYDRNYKNKVTDDMNVQNILIGTNLIISLFIIMYLGIHNDINNSHDSKIKEIEVRIDEINQIVKHNNDTISVVVNVYNNKK